MRSTMATAAVRPASIWSSPGWPNTTPVIVLRFEADNDAALARIKGEFRRVLRAAKPDIELPF